MRTAEQIHASSSQKPDWRSIDWRKAGWKVKELQVRIAKAEWLGHLKTKGGF